MLESVRLGELRRAPPEPAQRRPAAARRARPSAGQPAEGAAARRAARRARPEAARGDAGRAEVDPARGRHHVRVRHARSGRGVVDEQPHRGVQPRAHRAGRYAPRDLRPSGHARSSPASSAPPTCSVPSARSSCWASASRTRFGRSGCASCSTRPPTARSRLRGVVSDIQYLGADCRVRVQLDDGTSMIASVPSDGLAGVAIGGNVRLAWPRYAAFPVANTDISKGGDS